MASLGTAVLALAFLASWPFVDGAAGRARGRDESFFGSTLAAWPKAGQEDPVPVREKSPTKKPRPAAASG